MKTIIAFKGSAGTGKTSTILEIIKILEKKGQLIHDEIFGPVDRIVIIKIGNNKIGIGSAGDYGVHVEENLKLFSKHNCKIIICATRTSGATKDAVDDYTPKGYKIIFTSNYYTDKADEIFCNKMNEICARNIEQLVIKL